MRKFLCLAGVLLLAACGPPDENNGSNNGDSNGTNNATTAENNGSNGDPNNGSNNGSNGDTSNGTAGTNNDTNAGMAVSFEMDIAPLINSNCNNVGCHASPGQGNFAIEGSDVADIASALDGTAASTSDNNLVEPSEPASSEIFIRVSGMARTQMPLGGQLDTTEIDLIQAWIAAGAPFDS